MIDAIVPDRCRLKALTEASDQRPSLRYAACTDGRESEALWLTSESHTSVIQTVFPVDRIFCHDIAHATRHVGDVVPVVAPVSRPSVCHKAAGQIVCLIWKMLPSGSQALRTTNPGPCHCSGKTWPPRPAASS